MHMSGALRGIGSADAPAAVGEVRVVVLFGGWYRKSRLFASLE
jgi:hypothetical protein